MKKSIYILFCIAIGLLVASCEVTSLDENKVENTDFLPSVESSDMGIQDSITTGEGPGDGAFPIKPPKKIN